MKNCLAALFALCTVCVVHAADAPVLEKGQKAAPVDADVVFVLDTTGSMSGLIEGAKQKIWSIAADIVQQTGGKVRIALLPYRDRGDAYVTEFYPLSDDLDKVYSTLQTFRAGGGGDAPESVNQALYEAVTLPQWSTGNRTMRTIFLVGDCPPHMDYQDDVKYPATCKLATARNIVIHTVRCGSDSVAGAHWAKIAALTNGGFSSIGQSGNMTVETTPYDAEIAKITIKVGATALPYGSLHHQREVRKKLDEISSAKPEDAAARNAYRVTKSKVYDVDFASCEAVSGNDLVSAPAVLSRLDKSELPPELKNLDEARQKALIAERQELRAQYNRKLAELNVKRADYLAKKAESSAAPRDSFDREVSKSIGRQLKSLRSDDTLKKLPE